MSDAALHEALRVELRGDLPVARLVDARLALGQVVVLVAGMIRQAVADGHPHLLLDAGLAAFGPPTLSERLDMVRQWAAAADGRLRIALVAPPGLIDPERFGVVAAANFGLAGQVFEQEAEAVAWLREERAAELRRASSPGQA